MRDDMRVGDLGFFYHSPYFDPKSDPANPRWVQVQVELMKKTRLLSLAELREIPALSGMRLLQKGNRLSITPVSGDERTIILRLLEAP